MEKVQLQMGRKQTLLPLNYDLQIVKVRVRHLDGFVFYLDVSVS